MSDFDLSEWVNSDDVSSETPNEVLPVLTTNEVSILNFCEQTFWETGMLPTPERVVEDLNVSQRAVATAFSKEAFQNQLASRGIDPVGLITVGKVIKETKALSPKQILVANMMLNLHDKRSEREKLAQVQVSSQQYHAWLRQPQFIEFLRKRGEALFSSSDFEAYKSLVRNVKGGDNKSLELFFRMRGIYRPEINVNLNIDVVLQRVVEVISTHVKDPHVLQAIASEIENIIDVEGSESNRIIS